MGKLQVLPQAEILFTPISQEHVGEADTKSMIFEAEKAIEMYTFFTSGTLGANIAKTHTVTINPL